MIRFLNYKHQQINIYKVKYYTTETTTETVQNDAVKKSEIIDNNDTKKSVIPEQITVSKIDTDDINPPNSLQKLKEKISANNEKIDEMFNKTERTKEYVTIKTQISGNDKTKDDDKTIDNLILKIEDPVISSVKDTPTDTDLLIEKIKLTSKIVGDKVAQKLKEQEIMLEETERAVERQNMLYDRISEFVKSLGIKKTVTTIGFALGIGYTVYHLLRYREIPLGGFIKGMFTGVSSNIPTSATNNNITVNFPSAETLKNVSEVPKTLSSSLASLLDNLGPVGMTAIVTVIWILRRTK